MTVTGARYAGSEFALHRYVIDLLRFTAKPGVIYFHVPNGEWRSPRTGARLKALGVLPGVADICIIGRRGLTYFIELKTAKGVQSPEQKAFYERCVIADVPYRIVRSPEDARSILRTWDLIQDEAAGVVRRAA